MGLSVYEGTFAKLSGNGAQTVVGVPFRPRAIIFWGCAVTGTSLTDGLSAHYGFTDGVNNCVVTCASEDASASSDGISNHTNAACIDVQNINADGTNGQAVLTTFNSDGFTITWTSSAATTETIHYWAITGDDITNIKVGIQTVGTAATGIKSYTGVGFPPDFLLTANDGFIKATAQADAESNASCGLGISAMKSPTERWAIMAVSEGGRVDADTWRYQTITKCFSLLDNLTGTVTGEADFVSFDPDGFTWNYTTTGANITNSKFIYLAIKGGVWNVGSHTFPAANSVITNNTSADGMLKGLQTFTSGIDAANLGVVAATSILTIGGSDGIRQSYVAISDLDAAATMATVRVQSVTQSTVIIVANATAASSSVISTGAVQSFGPNSFLISYTASDGSARVGQYFALSEKLQPHSFGKINTMFDNNTGGAIFG